MRIFVYEHITGGGMLDDPRIAALASEGVLMLRALVDDLTAIPGVEVSVMRDSMLAADLPGTAYAVSSAAEFWPTFRKAVREADAVWPIAPEQDDILARVTREILDCGRTLLGCRLDAVEIAASKHATAAILSRAGIGIVQTWRDEAQIPAGVSELVVKPNDGAGCQDTLLFASRPELRTWLENHANPKQIFQPFVRGESRSLSVLCCEGRARLLACNRQKVEIREGEFGFGGVSVNALTDRGGRYVELAAQVARALPGLWGYCGIDFIETDSGPVVVEVNPRLTTSYAGLRRAIGVNPAQLVLGLPGSLETSGKAIFESCAIEVEVAHAG